ncbi:hypothetical protein VSR69_39525 [Paraburkholderia phytofirmans]
MTQKTDLSCEVSVANLIAHLFAAGIVDYLTDEQARLHVPLDWVAAQFDGQLQTNSYNPEL